MRGFSFAVMYCIIDIVALKKISFKYCYWSFENIHTNQNLKIHIMQGFQEYAKIGQW